MKTNRFVFRRIKKAIDLTGLSVEKIAAEMHVSGNGLRYALNKQTISLSNFLELCRTIKIHPSFINFQKLEPGNFLLKAKPEEVDPLHMEIQRLRRLNVSLESENEILKKIEARWKID
ncbi:MAG: hypothetical protein IPP71_04005 [Bacteroidetes bacterium]|nr:hypothetical protein [Bacteroidota bacterium]